MQIKMKNLCIGYRGNSYCQEKLGKGLQLKGQQPTADEQGQKKEKAESLE
jgi:hypothetical protein